MSYKEFDRVSLNIPALRSYLLSGFRDHIIMHYRRFHDSIISFYNQNSKHRKLPESIHWDINMPMKIKVQTQSFLSKNFYVQWKQLCEYYIWISNHYQIFGLNAGFERVLQIFATVGKSMDKVLGGIYGLSLFHISIISLIAYVSNILN